MISRKQALVRLKSFDMDISRLYPASVLDYRGRNINAESVRCYLKTERHRFAEVATLVPDPPFNGARLLDIGIAYGFLAALLKEDGAWQCEGVDLAENIPVYGAFVRHHNIPLHSGKLGIQPLPFPDETFQAVIFSEVLEHLRLAPSLVFKELRRLLTEEGFLVLTTPNMARFTHILKLLGGRNPIEPFPSVITENITEYWTHVREYTMGELKNLLHCYGFRIIQARYSRCMERGRIHSWVTTLVPPWRGDLMILAQKRS